jgi:predicted lactoylglutathione lyase
LPVKDLNKTVAFFTKLGFTFNPQFTDENATWICDTSKYTDAILALSADTREKADQMIKKLLNLEEVNIESPKIMDGCMDVVFKI